MPSPAANAVKIEPVIAGQEDRFIVASHLEITHILHAIMREAKLITVTLSVDDFFLTSILAIDEDSNSVILERARGKPRLSNAIKSRMVSYSTMLDKVEIRFTCAGIEAVEYSGSEAYRIPLPGELLRIQRREHYRITTPLISPVKCRISTGDSTDDARVELALCDISCGGIAVQSPSSIFNPELGACYSSIIHLPGTPGLQTIIQARNAFMVNLANGKTSQRLGFAYVNPKEAMLMTIQRYILSLERLHRTRAGGGG